MLLPSPDAPRRLPATDGVAQNAIAHQGELRDGLDLTRLSYQIAASVWGVVLLWEKGILVLEELRPAISLNHFLTLTPLCVGKRRELMEAGLHEVLQLSHPGAAGPMGNLQLVDG